MTLGVTSLVAGYVLSDLLTRFARAFPDITVELVEDSHDYLEHLLLNGEIDLAVVTTSGLHNPESLAADELDFVPIPGLGSLGAPAGEPKAG